MHLTAGYLRKTLKSNRGWSVTELMVATALMSLLMAALGAIYTNGQKSFMFLENNLENMQTARRSSNILARDIRSTISITSATSSSFVFSGDFDGDGTSNDMAFNYNSGTHTLTRTVDSKTTTVSSGVVNDEAHPFFEYYDQDNNKITDPANYTLAKEVAVTVYVDNSSTAFPIEPIKLRTSVQLRNLHERH
jgi:type II secretory pathway pseudopilin PulG